MLRSNDKKGISLLLAVIITTLALLFSYAITNIAIKELLLSQAGRDSQIAFYASNSGAECALYWDLKRFSFPTDNSNPSPNLNCADDIKPANFNNNNNIPDQYYEWETGDFLLEGDQNGPCFNLVIIKEWNDEPVPNGQYYETKIESRGHNVCDPASPRKLERALRVTY